MRKLLEELFSKYYKDIYTYLYSLSRDVSLSEDLAQEVFLEVVKSIAAFRGESNIKTWLFSIARHRWYSYLRKNSQQAKTEDLSEFIESNEKPPDEQYQDEEVTNRIYALLDLEPERTRSIVVMRLEGYSFYEIGVKHGISENSARVIDFRAKTKIRQILKKEGFICE